MRIDYIKVENFFNHQKREINFEDYNSPLLISGTNGVGKSSLITESLSFALYGQTRVDNIDDSIKHNEESTHVTIKFKLNNQNIEITRSKKRNKPQKLQLIINDIEIEELLSELQKRINTLIGLSKESLYSAILLKQNEDNRFADASSEERQQIISDILDLSQYERLEKLAKEKRSELKSAIKAKQNIIDSLSDINIEELQKDLKHIHKFIDSNQLKLVDLEDKYSLLRGHNIAILEKQEHRNNIYENNNKIMNRIEKSSSDIENLEEDLKKINNFLKNTTIKDIEPLQNSVSAIQNQLDDTTEKITLLKDNYNSIVKDKVKTHTEIIQTLNNDCQVHIVNMKNHQNNLDKLNKLKDADCPTCLRKLNNKELVDMKQSLQSDIDNVQQDLEKSKKPLLKAQKELELFSEGEFSEALVLKEKIGKYQKKYTDIKSSLKEEQEELQIALKNQKSIIESNEKLKSKQNEINKCNEDIAFLEQQIQKVPEIKEELKDETSTKEKLQIIRTQQDEAILILAKVENNIDNANKEFEKKKIISEEISNNKLELELVELLVVAFSKNGIPLSIINTVLPEIQNIANFYLGKMSDDTFEFQFKTTNTLKNGEVKNTLDLSVYDGHIWRNFESFSGGEKFKISLSIRLALSKVLARRAGIQLETLIMDEPGTALDEQGKQAFCSIIKSLKDIFPRIIITTHLDIKDEFENRIEL